MEIGSIIIVLAALAMEIIDAGLGLGYGTVLTPLLITLGYSPLVIIPSVLLSQAIGGLTASTFHYYLRNVDFKPKSVNPRIIWQSFEKRGLVESFKRGFTTDFKIVLAITFIGIIATIIGAFTAVKIPKEWLKGYIGVLVLLIGLLLISKKVFQFSWKKMIGVGLLASFNKGISGGGFGPVTTGGQVIAGNTHKSSIGCTTLAEAPICITGFLTYLYLKGISDYSLLITLSIGALLGAPLGALLTKKLSSSRIKMILGVLIIILGALILLELSGLFKIGISG